MVVVEQHCLVISLELYNSRLARLIMHAVLIWRVIMLVKEGNKEAEEDAVIVMQWLPLHRKLALALTKY